MGNGEWKTGVSIYADPIVPGGGFLGKGTGMGMAECTYHDNLLLIQGDFLRNLLDGLLGVHHGLVLVLGVDGAGHFGWQAGCRGCGVVAGWVSWGVSGNAET